MTITINTDRFQAFLDEYLEMDGDADPDDLDQPTINWIDLDTLETFVQRALESTTPLDLPEGAEAIVYFLGGDDPGFIFGLRPKNDGRDIDPELEWVNVTTIFVECRDIEPRDAKGRVPVDGGEFDTVKSALDVLQNIADELTPLLPAYRKLWPTV